MEEEIKRPWDCKEVEKELKTIMESGNEQDLLKLIRNNSFLLYELYSRPMGCLPAFHEIPFGNYRLDFAWLNDNSDGPEWVLVEIEKPRMTLFTKKGEPTQELNHAIQQVESWDKYFQENPTEKNRIFGAVSRFRYILVAGDKEDWKSENNAKWRIYHNAKSNIEIHSLDILRRPLEIIKSHPEEFWKFAETPKTLPSTDLKRFWEGYRYMDFWRKIIQ